MHEKLGNKTLKRTADTNTIETTDNGESFKTLVKEKWIEPGSNTLYVYLIPFN
jgi:hypothetical protein